MIYPHNGIYIYWHGKTVTSFIVIIKFKKHTRV